MRGAWVRKIPWRRAWQLTPVYLPGESPWTEEPGGLQSMESQSRTWLSYFTLLLHCRWIIYHLSQTPHSQLWRVAATHNSHICLHSGNRNGHNPVLTQCFSNSDGKPKLRTIKFASFTFPLNLNSHLSPLISHLRIPSQGCLPGKVCSGTAQSKEGGIKPLHSSFSMSGQLEFQILPHLENTAHSLRNEGRVLCVWVPMSMHVWLYVWISMWACVCACMWVHIHIFIGNNSFYSHFY